MQFYLLDSLKIYSFRRSICIARKKTRHKNESFETFKPELFISDDFTPFNYKLYEQLKLKCERAPLEHSTNYETVYSFEGNIYVKQQKQINLSLKRLTHKIFCSKTNKLFNFKIQSCRIHNISISNRKQKLLKYSLSTF